MLELRNNYGNVVAYSLGAIGDMVYISNLDGKISKLKLTTAIRLFKATYHDDKLTIGYREPFPHGISTFNMATRFIEAIDSQRLLDNDRPGPHRDVLQEQISW